MADIDDDYDPSIEKKEVAGWGDRLALAISAKNTNKISLAKHLKIRHSAISKWASDTPPSARPLLRAAQFLGVSPYWLLFGEGPEEDIPKGLQGYQIPIKRESLKAPLILSEETLQALGIDPEHFGCYIAKDPAFRNTYKPGSILIVNCDPAIDPNGWVNLVWLEGRRMIRRTFIPPRDKGMIFETEDKDPEQRIVFTELEWQEAKAKGKAGITGRIEACWGKE